MPNAEKVTQGKTLVKNLMTAEPEEEKLAAGQALVEHMVANGLTYKKVGLDKEKAKELGLCQTGQGNKRKNRSSRNRG